MQPSNTVTGWQYKETVTLAVAKMRSGVSTGNYGPFLYDARNERKKEAAEKRARMLENPPKKSGFKPEFLDPAASSSRKRAGVLTKAGAIIHRTCLP